MLKKTAFCFFERKYGISNGVMQVKVMNKIVHPGYRIGHINEYIAASGTVERDFHVYATIVGRLEIKEEFDGKKIVTVIGKTNIIPAIGDTILGKVAKINNTLAYVDILVINSTPLTNVFKGIIRRQDVRRNDRDNVVMYQSFLPGDIIRAEIISMGDASVYFLGTAKVELGVVIATSIEGQTMEAMSWKEMRCPVSGSVELRKCAKP
jgi:exosome complex component CSL4